MFHYHQSSKGVPFKLFHDLQPLDLLKFSFYKRNETIIQQLRYIAYLNIAIKKLFDLHWNLQFIMRIEFLWPVREDVD